MDPIKHSLSEPGGFEIRGGLLIMANGQRVVLDKVIGFKPEKTYLVIRIGPIPGAEISYSPGVAPVNATSEISPERAEGLVSALCEELDAVFAA